jgi:hypothetical protein
MHWIHGWESSPAPRATETDCFVLLEPGVLTEIGAAAAVRPQRLVRELVTAGALKDREVEAAKKRARWAQPARRLTSSSGVSAEPPSAAPTR